MLKTTYNIMINNNKQKKTRKIHQVVDDALKLQVKHHWCGKDSLLVEHPSR
jgi:hypothetical protein